MNSMRSCCKHRAAQFAALFSLLLCFLSTASAQRQRAETPFREAPIRFDVVTFAGKSPDSVRTDIYFAVPYSLLEFLHNGDNYLADYSVAVTLNDGISALYDRYYTYRVSESSSEHSTRVEKGLSRADAEQVSAVLRPHQHYDMHLVFRDLHSRREIDTNIEVQTGDFRNLQPALSDILLFRTRRGNRIVPSIGGDASEIDSERGGAFAEAYHLHPDSSYGIVCEISHVQTSDAQATDEATIAVRSVVVGSHANSTPILMPLSFNELWAGRYKLTLYLLSSVTDTAYRGSDLSKHAIATSDRTVTVRMAHGIPLASSDLNEAIEQLRIIATAFEWDSLDRARTTTEKRDAIIEFWRKRDIEAADKTRERDRPMKVFYARIEYANNHFGYGFTPGWKSDRGRLFVQLGAPDNLERHAYEANEKPYEIWEYYRPMHVRYVFVDPYMLGDYRLNGAMPPDGTFIWDENE
jgi:GWxTD domain-containing protein